MLTPPLDLAGGLLHTQLGIGQCARHRVFDFPALRRVTHHI